MRRVTKDAPGTLHQGCHVDTWMLQFAAMEPDEILAIVCTAMLPFFAGLMGATPVTITVVTFCYVAAVIASVKRKHHQRQRDR